MLRKALHSICLALLLVCTGCVYSHVRSPLDIDVDRTELGSKVGRANSYSIAWLVAWGDGGTQAAAKDGGLTVIKHLDTEVVFVLFGLYSRVTTIAYGD